MEEGGKGVVEVEDGGLVEAFPSLLFHDRLGVGGFGRVAAGDDVRHTEGHQFVFLLVRVGESSVFFFGVGKGVGEVVSFGLSCA